MTDDLLSQSTPNEMDCEIGKRGLDQARAALAASKPPQPRAHAPIPTVPPEPEPEPEVF